MSAIGSTFLALKMAAPPGARLPQRQPEDESHEIQDRLTLQGAASEEPPPVPARNHPKTSLILGSGLLSVLGGVAVSCLPGPVSPAVAAVMESTEATAGDDLSQGQSAVRAGSLFQTQEAPAEQDLERVFQAIDASREEVITLQRELVSRPAISPAQGGQGEVEKAEYLKTYLQDLGWSSCEEIRVPDPAAPSGYRPNLVFRFKGRSSDRTVWIMSHMDTVPAGNPAEWQSDPFDLKVEGDTLYGRGVEDNHQGIVSSLIAVKAFHDTGVVPEHDLGLLFVADEELGSDFGIKQVLREKPDLFKEGDLVLVPDYGNAEGTLVEVAEKSIAWMKFTTHGKTAHAARPDLAVNAHRAGAALLLKLNGLYQHFELQDPLFEPPYSTFEPTKKEANVPNINSIPGQDVFYMDMRVLPTYKLDEVKVEIRETLKEIEEQYGVSIELEVIEAAEAAPATPVDAPVVRAVIRAVKDVYDKDAVPRGIGGGTVASFIREAGIPAVVWSSTDDTAHMANESAKISNLLGDAKVFAHILSQPADTEARTGPEIEVPQAPPLAEESK